MNDIAIISKQFGLFSYSIRFEKLNRFASLGNYAKSYLYVNGSSVNNHTTYSNSTDTLEAINDCRDYSSFLEECFHILQNLNIWEINYLLDQNGEFEKLTNNLILLSSKSSTKDYVKTGHFIRKPALPGSYHYTEFRDQYKLLGDDSQKVYVIEKIELFNNSLEVKYYDLNNGIKNNSFSKSFLVPSYFGKCVKVAFFLNILYQVIRYNDYWFLETYPPNIIFGSVDWEMRKLINEYNLYSQKL